MFSPDFSKTLEHLLAQGCLKNFCLRLQLSFLNINDIFISKNLAAHLKYRNPQSFIFLSLGLNFWALQIHFTVQLQLKLYSYSKIKYHIKKKIHSNTSLKVQCLINTISKWYLKLLRTIC